MKNLRYILSVIDVSLREIATNNPNLIDPDKKMTGVIMLVRRLLSYADGVEDILTTLGFEPRKK